MKRYGRMVLGLFTLGCSQPLPIVGEPDAGSPDAASADAGSPATTGTHCELAEGASFVDLGSPLSAEAVLGTSQEVLATHEGAVAAASWGEVHVSSRGGDWEALSSDGLPHDRIGAITFHDGTWWVGLAFAAPPLVFRYVDEATGWEAAGTPSAGSAAGVLSLISFEGSLLASTFEGLFVLEPPSTWRPIDFAGGFVQDVVTSDGAVYVVMRSADGETIIQRSTDLATWETLPWEAGVVSEPADLAAGGGIVIATPGLFGTNGYYRFDAATRSFVAVPTPDGIVPTWIAEDGTVMGMQRVDFGSEAVFAAALGEEWSPPSGLTPGSNTSGTAIVWNIASEGTAIFIGEELGTITPFGVPIDLGTRLLRSDDHGRTFRAAISARHPAPILDASTDGDTYLVRLRGDLNEVHYVALASDDTWVDRTELLASPALDGVSGLEVGDRGMFVTRPSEYSQVVPQVSENGALTWSPLELGYPTYSTNISWGVRRTSAYAMDADGRLYGATIGGVTSLCCDGSKTPWGYRPGAGVWRYAAEEWRPVNAGIPIEAPPAPIGGPPFRSDVRSIAWTALGMLAVFEGRGVHRLAGDRWYPENVGLPLELVPTIAALEDTAIAWGDGRLFVLDRGVWITADAGTELVSVAARHDLLARAAGEGVAISTDRGESWTTLEGVERPVFVTLSRDRLFVTDDAQRVHAIAIRCTEEM